MTLPDFLTQETEAAILARMLTRIPDDLDVSEGEYVYDVLSAVAGEIAQIKADMVEYHGRGFISTTFGEYLDLKGEESGFPRRAGAKAVGQVRFTGMVGTVITPGTIVSTTADAVSGIPAIEFVTLAKVIIPEDGSIIANIEAIEAGAAGNVLAGAINVLSTPISGIAAVTNDLATNGGANIESDKTYQARLLQALQETRTSGNKADYMRWVMDIPGVGAAQVEPHWNGHGTVKVYLLGTDKQPVNVEVVNAAQAYIDPTSGVGDGMAPICASATVVSATGVNINVAASVTRNGTKTLAEIKAAFEAALVDYLQGIAFTDDPTVRYVRIGSMLLDTLGVQDYSGLTINGGTGNVAISLGQVGVKGTVTLNE